CIPRLLITPPGSITNAGALPFKKQESLMPAAVPLPQKLGDLRASHLYSEARLKSRSVKDEMRENLIARLRARTPVFPGVIGYEDSVVPQIVNAVLSRHNFILLGLRGQAKSRILRALTDLLDEQ